MFLVVLQGLGKSVQRHYKASSSRRCCSGRQRLPRAPVLLLNEGEKAIDDDNNNNRICGDSGGSFSIGCSATTSRWCYHHGVVQFQQQLPTQPRRQVVLVQPHYGCVSFSTNSSTHDIDDDNDDNRHQDNESGAKHRQEQRQELEQRGGGGDGGSTRADASGTTTTTTTMSKRRQFKSIPVSPSILRYIQSIGVGIPQRIIRKRRRQRSSDDATEGNSRKRGVKQPPVVVPPVAWREPPAPFGRNGYPVKIMGSVGTTTTTTTTATIGGSSSSSSRTDDLPSQRQRQQQQQQPSSLQQPPPPPIFPSNSTGIPEVALMGRSNVGKSTLLNAVLYGNRGDNNSSNTNNQTEHFLRRNERSDVVRLPAGVKAATSSRPGETRKITFYQLKSRSVTKGSTGPDEADNDDDEDCNSNAKSAAQDESGNRQQRHNNTKNNNTNRLWLVDLPGFGFAYMKSEESEALRQLMISYILERCSAGGKKKNNKLKRILLLIDARHGMKRTDLEFLELLQQEQQQRQMHSSSTSNASSQRQQERHGHDGAGAAVAGRRRKGGQQRQRKQQNKKQQQRRKLLLVLPPIQIVLTKCDLVTQQDLARRVVQVQEQLSDALRRETGQCPVMLVSAKTTKGANVKVAAGQRQRQQQQRQRQQGGILELQKELASLVLVPT